MTRVLIRRGRFVTIEGGEGTGKSTLLAGLRDKLPQNTVFTREPGGSEGAEAIRTLIVDGPTERWDGMTEMLLLTAARRDHVRRLIDPSLDVGLMVVCDRYVDSTRAYQGQRGTERGLIERLHQSCVGLDPDLTIILDAPVGIAMKRTAARKGGAERFEGMGLEFHHALREAFLDIAASNPRRCAVVDAAQAPEAVLDEVLALVSARFDPIPEHPE